MTDLNKVDQKNQNIQESYIIFQIPKLSSFPQCSKDTWKQLQSCNREYGQQDTPDSDTIHTYFPKRKSFWWVQWTIWMCSEKEQQMAHYRGVLQRSSFLMSTKGSRALCAVQTGSQAQRSIFHQWQVQKQTKNWLIVFLCFALGYTQWPLVIFILNYTGLRLTKQSFKVYKRYREPERCKELQLLATPFAASIQTWLAEDLPAHPHKTSTAEYGYANAQGKNSWVWDFGKSGQTWKSFFWKHKALLTNSKNINY